eukprot:CAMPEP_0119480308 /NCGR_PEP_ID=MMETSP1344-20130328/9172_1 /TAXON_ID=236787 /ORGANISM="Florenciella parvula, Strain CCMP2471" /LENGTH=83 /DNA_ID=CAMNT_0007514601 /DNA_START=75 /DNA_END=323 /DNA_ORIENTATION=+
MSLFSALLIRRGGQGQIADWSTQLRATNVGSSELAPRTAHEAREVLLVRGRDRAIRVRVQRLLLGVVEQPPVHVAVVRADGAV